jgi:hypothetical protein
MSTDVIVTPEFAKAYQLYSKEICELNSNAVMHSNAYNYSNDTSDITSRNPYLSSDRQYNRTFGNSSRLSSSTYEMESLIWECMDIYDNEAIVSNIVDLMSDFATQGVRITAADKRQEKFGQQWFSFVQGPERSERFLSTLFRSGTVIAKRTDGKVPLKTQKKWKSTAADSGENAPINEKITIKEFDAGRAIMPLKWTFYTPLDVVMVGGEIANFVGKPIFGLKINTQLRMEINQLARLNPTQKQYQEFRELIPDYVFDAINNNSLFFPLDQSKVYAYYYKKDDNQLYGKPLIRPIIKDIRHLNKLKAADSAALNGVISSIRLWTMGSLEKGIVPSKGALDKLRSVIAECLSGGAADLVWGPDLKFQESSTNAHQFLGSEKYKVCLAAINAGLGIPDSMSGSSKSNTTDFMGLRTLVERLEYGRMVLVTFLKEQLALVQKAMGFTKEFEVEFDEMVLSDEAAQKALYIQLYDRGIISMETLRYSFNIDHSDIENAKIAREDRKRGKSLPHRASPYHNPEKEHDLMKLAVQKGGVTPSQVGLNFPQKKKDEETFNDSGETPTQKMLGEQKKKMMGSPMTGRPQNAKDKVIRKKRRVLPKGASAKFSDLFLFAESAQQKVEEIVNPVFIAIANKKNVRSLSTEETVALEALKIRILTNIEPYSEVSAQLIHSISSSLSPLDDDMYRKFKTLESSLIKEYGRDLTVAEQRSLLCRAYAIIFSDNFQKD